MMAQFLRMYKSKICCVVRSYGTRRYQQNHYETLNVSPNASQKEIKRAFLRLSKELHPDTSGKHSHTDFVKLNEAYSILGKENIRRQYDLELKYNKYNPSYTYYSQNRQYGNPWEYEMHKARGSRPPSQQQNSNLPFGRLIVYLFIGLGLVHLIFFLHSMRVKQQMRQRNNQLENQYHRIRNEALNRSNDSRYSIDNINSAKDLNEYLKPTDESSN